MSAPGETPAARSEKGGGKGKKKEEHSLTLRQVKSGICAPKDQKATLKGLGFRRLGQRVVHRDDGAVRGMIHKVRHLVEVEVAKD